MTAKEIILDYLKNNKFDGLVCPHIQCGCGIDDFMPCDENWSDCQPAFKLQCANCKEWENIDSKCPGKHEDFCYSTEKYEIVII
jgi:hypothetical protein